MKTFVGYCNCPTEVFSFLDGALSLFRALRGVYSERSEAGEGRCDAEDIFQEVFLRYFRSAPVFSEEEHRRAWLIRVTVNCAKKFWTSAWMRRTVPLEEAEGLFQETEDTLLWEQLQLLPGQYRAVLHLFYYEQLSVGEIGKLLGEKPATVRTQLTRARRLLRKQLKEEE